MPAAKKRAITERYTSRIDAERYRDRFKAGRHARTHAREGQALDAVLSAIGHIDTILDVGSGPGRFIPHFVRAADRVIQMDYAMPMLAVSRDDHPAPARWVGYVQADARLMPFMDQSVDVVFCHRLLNHVPLADDRVMILRHFARIARHYVVISCLPPLVPLRLVRRLVTRMRLQQSRDEHVDPTDALSEAATVGLRVWRRERIRSFPVVGEFHILQRVSAAVSAVESGKT